MIALCIINDKTANPPKKKDRWVFRFPKSEAKVTRKLKCDEAQNPSDRQSTWSQRYARPRANRETSRSRQIKVSFNNFLDNFVTMGFSSSGTGNKMSAKLHRPNHRSHASVGLLLIAVAVVALLSTCEAFVSNPARRPLSSPGTTAATTPIITHRRLFVDPTSFSIDAAAAVSSTAPPVMDSLGSFFSSSSMLSFTDQGKNLAGTFFQASLLPYLVFLYFLQFRANRLNDLSNFGFQFILLFVLSTIPSGIVTKSVYGVSLADCDWLHGGAESLLTVANVLIVSGCSSSFLSQMGVCTC